MGAYSPAPVVTPAVEQAVMARIVVPALAALKARGTPFIGVLFAGLMIADDEPRLIEFNVRFGDPECQVLMPRLQTDILTLMTAACAGALQGMEVAHSPDAALAVVMAAEGYPAKPRAGSRIGGLAEAEAMPGIRIFQAGTALRDGELVAAGGRVLAVTGMGATVAAARQAAYAAVDRLAWPQGFCRRDIGWRALEPR
jgi:phosphoribosylamine--glycine ligase